MLVDFVIRVCLFIKSILYAELYMDKKRCDYFCCKKKLGLVRYKCRCGGEFCTKHRLSEQHECNYDYKLLIEQKQPVIAPKIQKI